MHYAGRVTGGTIEGTVSGGAHRPVERDPPMRLRRRPAAACRDRRAGGPLAPTPSAGSSTSPRPASATTSSTAASASSSSTSTPATASCGAFPTFEVPAGSAPENIKGIAAHAGTSRLYLTTPLRVAAFDLTTDRLVWNRQYPGGADRLALSPDGRLLYVPSFEGPHWHAVDAATGDIVAKVDHRVGRAQHDLRPGRTACLPGGTEVVDAEHRRSGDPHRHPPRRSVQPLDPALHDRRRADARLRQRQRPARLRSRRHHDRPRPASCRSDRVPEGPGETPRLPQPRHRPDARRARDLADRRRQQHAARLRQHRLRRQGRSPASPCATSPAGSPSAWTAVTPIRPLARSSTPPPGRVVATLTDETGRAVQSEKVVEVVFSGGRPVRTGDQFGIGRKP